jgi:hypothetical protein
LGNDIGEWRDDKKPAQAMLVSLSQKVSGDRGGLPQADRRLARDNWIDEVTGPAGGVQLSALCVAKSIPPLQRRDVLVQGSYSFFPARGGRVRRLAQRVVSRGVLVVSVYEA